MYYPYIRDWLEVFPRDQVLVIRAEDYFDKRIPTLHEIVKFLGLGKSWNVMFQ